MYNPQEKVKGVLDVVFLIDVTGSMQPWIDSVKENIRHFFSELGKSEVCTIKDWRAKIVGFRDYEEDGPSMWLEDNSFTTDVNELKRQLDSLCACGGGDIPESMLDALYTIVTGPQSEDVETALPGEWRERHVARRAVVVFTDAPFKDPMAAPNCAGGTSEDVRVALDARHIMLFCVANANLDCFNWAERYHLGKWFQVPARADMGSYFSNADTMSELLRSVGRTLTQTMSGSMI